VGEARSGEVIGTKKPLKLENKFENNSCSSGPQNSDGFIGIVLKKLTENYRFKSENKLRTKPQNTPLKQPR
jgi:hypothetical protein